MVMHGPDRSRDGRRPRRRADVGTSLDALESRELMSNTLGAAELLNPPPAVVSAPANAPRGPQAPNGLDLDEVVTYRRWKRQQPPATPPAQGPANPTTPPPSDPPAQTPAKPDPDPSTTPSDPPADPAKPSNNGQDPANKAEAGDPKPAEAAPPKQEQAVAIDPASPKTANGKPVDPKSGKPDTGPIATPPNGPRLNSRAAAQPPSLLRPLIDFEVKEGTLILQNVSSLESGAPQGVKYSLEAAIPAGATIDPNTGKINWMPKDGPSIQQLTIKAVAPDGRSETKTVKATITNEIPTVWLGPDLTLASGAPLSRSISVFDPGDDAVTLTVDYGDGKPAQVASLGSGRSYKLEHTYNGPGDYMVSVTAKDDDGGTTISRLSVRITQPQNPDPGNPNPGNPNPGNPNPGNPNPGNPNPGNPDPGNPNPGNPNPGNPNPGTPNPGNPNPGNPNPNPGTGKPNPGSPNPGNPNPGNPNPNPGNGGPNTTVIPARIKEVKYQPARGRQRAQITITFDKKIAPNLAGFEVRDSLGQIIPVRMSSNSRGPGGTTVTLMPYNNKISLTKNGAPQVRVYGDQLVDNSGVRVDANGDRIPGGTYAQVVSMSRRPFGRR